MSDLSIAEAMFMYANARSRRDAYVYLQSGRDVNPKVSGRFERDVSEASKTVDQAILRLIKEREQHAE